MVWTLLCFLQMVPNVKLFPHAIHRIALDKNCQVLQDNRFFPDVPGNKKECMFYFIFILNIVGVSLLYLGFLYRTSIGITFQLVLMNKFKVSKALDHITEKNKERGHYVALGLFTDIGLETAWKLLISVARINIHGVLKKQIYVKK